MNLSKKLWHGSDIWLYTLSGNKLTLEVTNLGCTIVSFKADGKNIVLGYATAAEYLNDNYYVGSIVGRCAGRISGAAFQIDGRRYGLTANEKGSPNHLHGGSEGFNKKIFAPVQELADAEQALVTFRYKSPHLEEGYPGNLDLCVTIAVNRSDEVIITYEARTDAPTFVNLTHHDYFNLTASGDGLQQQLQINAEEFVVSGHDFIPTGATRPVAGTRFDFHEPVMLSETTKGPGFNDYFIFSEHGPNIAMLTDPVSGRSLIIKTTFPGLLLYTGDYLGGPFVKNQGICLEAQGYPDAPNHPDFPAALLLPGEKYWHQTKFILENIDNL